MYSLHLRKFYSLLFGIFLVASFAQADSNSSKEEANRQLVVHFYERFFNEHALDSADVIAEDYRQHNPDVADGKQPFISFFSEFFKENPQARARIVRSAANGDLVWLHVHSTDGPKDRGQAVVDIFRVAEGKIVEHWDVIQAVPEHSANKNGLF